MTKRAHACQSCCARSRGGTHLRKKGSGKGVMSPGLLGWGMAKPCTKDSKDKGAKEPPRSGGQGPGPC